MTVRPAWVAPAGRLAWVLVVLAAAYAVALYQPVRAWYSSWDKVAHGVVFAGVYGGLAWALRWRPWGLAVLAAAMGAAVEVHQMFMPGFSPSWADWAADLVGIAVAAAVYGVGFGRVDSRIRGNDGEGRGSDGEWDGNDGQRGGGDAKALGNYGEACGDDGEGCGNAGEVDGDGEDGAADGVQTMNEAVISAGRMGSGRADGLSGFAWGAGLALVLVATLFRAGNRFVPLMVLEWLALGVLVALVVGWAAGRSGLGAVDSRVRGNDGTARGNGGLVGGHARWHGVALGVLLTAPFWWAGLQLLPVFGPISQVPASTWLSMLAGLPVVACLALPLAANDRQLRALLWAWLGVGVFQAVLGLLQLGFPGLLFDPDYKAPVLGTFGNRNGLANFLTMLLPLLLLNLLGAAPGGRRRRGQPRRWGARWGWGAALLLVVACLLATLSRMGIATGALVVVLALLLWRTVGEAGQGPRVWLLALPALLVGLALLAGGWEWLARFDADRLVADDALRALNRASTWQAAQAFWPWGSGLGTFKLVFPPFQAPELGGWFVNFAHNDYLELLMEGGVLVLPLLLALAVLVVQRLGRLWATRRQGAGPGGWRSADALALAAGLALLAQALHAWVDYPWRIPANAMLGAFMLGVFLRRPGRSSTE